MMNATSPQSVRPQLNGILLAFLGTLTFPAVAIATFYVILRWGGDGGGFGGLVIVPIMVFGSAALFGSILMQLYMKLGEKYGSIPPVVLCLLVVGLAVGMAVDNVQQQKLSHQQSQNWYVADFKTYALQSAPPGYREVPQWIAGYSDGNLKKPVGVRYAGKSYYGNGKPGIISLTEFVSDPKHTPPDSCDQDPQDPLYAPCTQVGVMPSGETIWKTTDGPGGRGHDCYFTKIKDTFVVMRTYYEDHDFTEAQFVTMLQQMDDTPDTY